MFIAHLPAAYLLTRCRLRGRPWGRGASLAFLLGAVLPDVDMLAFLLWDNGAFHHHSYLTHRPAFWLAVLGLGLAVRPGHSGRALAGLGLGALVHLALDSIAGQIAWGWPVWHAAHPLVVVPATQAWWVASFLVHWTFAVELVICAVAGILWLRRVP